MRFSFVGTGTAAPADGMRPSCIYCEMGAFSAVLDLGSGAVHTMCGLGIDPINLENVFFSHFHSDHASDLVMLMHSNNATPGKIRMKPLNLYGPKGLDRLVNTVMDLFPETVPEKYTLNIFEENPDGEEYYVSNVRVTSHLTGHTANSIAHRFESGSKTFVYTGDCAYSSALCYFCKGADVLITECSYIDASRTEDHLCVMEAAMLAEKAGTDKLVITHRYPVTARIDIEPEMRKHFSKKIYFHADGATLVF